MTPAKGKSSLDKRETRLQKSKASGYNGAVANSIEKLILTGQYCKPGMNSKETIKAFRAWQKNFRIEAQLMDKHYRKDVADNNPTADTT